MSLWGAGGFPDRLLGHVSILSCNTFQLCTHTYFPAAILSCLYRSVWALNCMGMTLFFLLKVQNWLIRSPDINYQRMVDRVGDRKPSGVPSQVVMKSTRMILLLFWHWTNRRVTGQQRRWWRRAIMSSHMSPQIAEWRLSGDQSALVRK